MTLRLTKKLEEPVALSVISNVPEVDPPCRMIRFEKNNVRLNEARGSTTSDVDALEVRLPLEAWNVRE